ncbi:cytokine-inducible SH2-containing protein-like isoform 1-T1 [Spinachia spinachia]
MILCVPGPRVSLPAALSTESPRGMRAGTVPSTPCLQSTPPLWDPTKDLRAIASNFCYLENSGTVLTFQMFGIAGGRTVNRETRKALEDNENNRAFRGTDVFESVCAGWYWGAVTAAQAHAALQEASEGAFLVRDSSHPLYMLTLSVRTARGPTSIRIQYSGAMFLLDSSSPARPSLSSFPNVPSLVQHYMGPERHAEEGDGGQVVEDAPSKPSPQTIQETSVVLKLKRAVFKPQGLPSLQHLTRLIINRHSDCPGQLPLPRPLLRYIQDYPFKV